MAATDAHPLPKKNAIYRVYGVIVDNTGAPFAGGLTGLAAIRSLDGAATGATTNTPTEITANSSMFFLDLTAAEMNTNSTAVKVTATNANARPAWFFLYPQAVGDVSVDVTSIDGQATVGNNATLNLKKLNVVNSAGDAIVAQSSGGNGSGINASGNGTGSGVLGTAGASGKISNLLDVLEGPEPTTATPNNATAMQILQYLKRRFFNRVTQTITTQTQYKDDSSTVVTTMPVSDDGTTQSKGKST
jgi:hypothetical protein